MSRHDDVTPMLPAKAVAWLHEQHGMNWVTERTLRTEREARRLSFRKIGGRICFRIRDLAEWLARDDDVRVDAQPRRGRGGNAQTSNKAAASGTVQKALATAEKLKRMK